MQTLVQVGNMLASNI